MNALKIISNSENFLPSERKIIIDLLQQTDRDCRNITFNWCTAFNSENGILGAFIPKYVDSIYLQKGIFHIYDYDVIRSYLINLLPTCAHELTHRKQYLENLLTYRIKCIPYIRELTIEKEARGEELRIEKLIEKGKIK